MDMDLTAYFARVGYGGDTAPGLDALQELITAHINAVPFENLDPFTGVPVDDLTRDALTDKLVRRRRGGYCYEQNGLMGYVLTELGYRVRRLAGRVVWMRPSDAPTPAMSHTVLAVTFPGCAGPYLVDVGFGGQTPTSPLRLLTGGEQETTHEPYRLEDRGDGMLLQAKVRDEWQSLYVFTTQTRPQIDLVVGSWWVSTHPSSHFVTDLMVARVSEDARMNLAGRNLVIHRAGRSEKTVLNSAAEVADALGELFGINLADFDRAALQARIETLPVGQPGTDSG
ncbi:arylamine N-acetyltransferase family protein [Mycobacterium vicinigordonae]|uniref:Arylamine N-acetyltransferase n=1 Tax=Mycobacterium vicinigordonae TaxID=1719132 RepID=A0A7D6DZ51_9MYCO|nr:arylamine N-acetyltransferase [Mycobacterium vicinigordonae]QLL07050.1 arylamine N-acetyltransferase [Mycobacterium vicinigordonae]